MLLFGHREFSIPKAISFSAKGGAGTYSDGKLTTRIHRGEIDYVFQRFVDHGAPKNILYDAHPHIGTDILHNVVSSIRQTLLQKGASILFNEKMTRIITQNGSAIGIETSNGSVFKGDAVILAAGHSARDTIECIHNQNILLEKKGFSVGFRVEHFAHFINTSPVWKIVRTFTAGLITVSHITTVSQTAEYIRSACVPEVKLLIRHPNRIFFASTE